MTARELEDLESYVDRYSLSEVLRALESICREKAEHLRANWQDDNTADLWEDCAEEIGNVTFKRHINNV